MITFVEDQKHSMDHKPQNPLADTKIRQLVRVRQPEELLIRPETERRHPINPDYNLKSPVTAEQLSKALENLKTNIRNEKESAEFREWIEVVQDRQVVEFQPQVDQADVRQIAGELQPVVSLGKR